MNFLAVLITIVNGIVIGSKSIKGPSQDYIVGGAPTEPFQYPWIVFIGIGNSQMCAGSLLDANTVVTAAHCVPLLGNLKVVSNVYDLSLTTAEENNLVYQVTDRIVHESYDGRTSQNDIAILKVRLTDGDPERIPADRVQLDDGTFGVPGTELTIAGWGSTSYGGSLSPVIQQTTISVLPNQKCSAVYSSFADSQICAGVEQGGRDSCQGDSGGPLFTTSTGKATLVGIVSYGSNCGQPGMPGVYTRVSTFRDWIIAHLN